MYCEPPINLPAEIPMWPKGKTPCLSPEDGVFPRLTYYLPNAHYRTGQSMLILPGGGYGMVCTAKEGHRPAQLLAWHGIAAGVLEYRHAPCRHPIPLIDAQRGMRHMRQQARVHELSTDQVGVLGFSAGGHLAGLLATQPDIDEGKTNDPLDGLPCVPNFVALVYPVVSMTAAHSRHIGSLHNLLGEDFDPQLAQQLSIEKAVRKETPPMFITHGQADNTVPSANSLELYQALTQHGVAATMHLYEGEDHGFGQGKEHVWSRAMLDWLEKRT